MSNQQDGKVLMYPLLDNPNVNVQQGSFQSQNNGYQPVHSNQYPQFQQNYAPPQQGYTEYLNNQQNQGYRPQPYQQYQQPSGQQNNNSYQYQPVPMNDQAQGAQNYYNQKVQEYEKYKNQYQKVQQGGPVFKEQDFIPNDAEIQKQKTTFVVHKIEYHDTLDGVALQYNVSKREIKIFNDLTGDDIYYLKELKIPNPDLQNLHQTTTEYDEEEIRKKFKIEALGNYVKDEDKNQCKYYLEMNDWDVTKAYQNYKEDLEFEKNAMKNQKNNKNMQKLLSNYK